MVPYKIPAKTHLESGNIGTEEETRP